MNAAQHTRRTPPAKAPALAAATGSILLAAGVLGWAAPSRTEPQRQVPAETRAMVSEAFQAADDDPAHALGLLRAAAKQATDPELEALAMLNAAHLLYRRATATPNDPEGNAAERPTPGEVLAGLERAAAAFRAVTDVNGLEPETESLAARYVERLRQQIERLREQIERAEERARRMQERAEQLRELASQQRREAGESAAGEQSPRQQLSDQDRLAEQTGRASRELQRDENPPRSPEARAAQEQARQQAERARRAQERAQALLDRGDTSNAAQAQSEAADALERAAEAAGSASDAERSERGDPEGQQQGGDDPDQTADDSRGRDGAPVDEKREARGSRTALNRYLRDMLDRERELRRRRAQILRWRETEPARVEKDW